MRNGKKQLRFSERGNSAPQKEYKIGEYNNEQKICADMARMSDNGEYDSTDFGNSLQSANLILDSGAMCHMTP